jgi:hypothetical protein
MKRHTFALTILLASLATPLLSVGSARCQSGPPGPRNQCEVCPLLEDYCNDYDYYYGYSEIATAEHDNELLDPRFDPETGRYVGHDEVKTTTDQVETVATDSELDEFYAACEDTCNAEVQEAYTAETVIEEEAADSRYDEEYYSEEYADDYDYNYDYESYDYDYEAADYWYDEAAETTEEVAVTEKAAEVVAEEAYDDSYDYDYGYDEYDNYDYEYETYDYEAYDYEAEVAAEYAAAEAAAAQEAPEVDPNPPVPPQESLTLVEQEKAHPPVVADEVLAAEDLAVEQAVAADAWDYEAEGYDPYEYDYEAYEYEYEVYENGAVATPVEEIVEETIETEELTSEHEADFADTWTDSVEDYSYQYDYDYDYDYGVDYEYQPEVETVEVEPVDQISPLASAVSRQALLGAANLLDSLSQVLKTASTGLERTASIESNIR